jgi:hypothetical protein
MDEVIEYLIGEIPTFDAKGCSVDRFISLVKDHPRLKESTIDDPYLEYVWRVFVKVAPSKNIYCARVDKSKVKNKEILSEYLFDFAQIAKLKLVDIEKKCGANFRLLATEKERQAVLFHGVQVSQTTIYDADVPLMMTSRYHRV